MDGAGGDDYDEDDQDKHRGSKDMWQGGGSFWWAMVRSSMHGKFQLIPFAAEWTICVPYRLQHANG